MAGDNNEQEDSLPLILVEKYKSYHYWSFAIQAVRSSSPNWVGLNLA